MTSVKTLANEIVECKRVRHEHRCILIQIQMLVSGYRSSMRWDSGELA